MFAAMGVWTWFTVIALVLFGLWLLNRTAFRRTTDAAGAQVGKWGRKIWSMDPLAVKNAEIDRKADELAEATRGLESCRGLISSVERQVKNGEMASKRAEALAEQFAKDGNDNKALEKLTEKESIDEDLARNREQLNSHNETYKNYLIKITNANKKITSLRKEAREQGVRLEMSKANANLAKLAPVVGKSSLSFDNLDEVNQEIESQIDANHAKGQVVHDLSRDGLEEIEAEERARNSAAAGKLAALKAKIGNNGAAH
jgi:phage shock protein A